MQPLPSVESLIAQLAVHGIVLPQGPVRVDGYGDSAELSRELLDLIKAGRKRAGTGLLWAYEHDREPIANAGDIEIVVDHRNQPALITRIVSSEVIAFIEVGAEYAAIEGEGDGSLQYWRMGHWNFFSRECRRIGREPTETMPVICNVFEVLHVLPAPSEGLGLALTDSVKLDVFGKHMLVVRSGGTWQTYQLGSDGKCSLVDVVVPDTLTESELAQYFDDLYHEAATPRRPTVVRLS